MIGYLADSILELVFQHVGFYRINQCCAWNNLVGVVRDPVIEDHIAGTFGVIQLQRHLCIIANVVVCVDIIPEPLNSLGRITFVAHAAVGLGTTLAIF
jgi:hypothetical protein